MRFRESSSSTYSYTVTLILFILFFLACWHSRIEVTNFKGIVITSTVDVTYKRMIIRKMIIFKSAILIYPVYPWIKKRNYIENNSPLIQISCYTPSLLWNKNYEWVAG